MRYDSLRELVIGMMAEAQKLHHLGIKYLIRRSTLAEANNRRSSSFFASIYHDLYGQYKHLLADSRSEDWVKRLYIMDSTTITLFSNILKGAGRNPKSGKKKGGIKAHTVIKADENVPCRRPSENKEADWQSAQQKNHYGGGRGKGDRQTAKRVPASDAGVIEERTDKERKGIGEGK